MQESREDRIRHRAHQLWEEQGRPEGMHDQHWEQARAQIDEDDATPTARLEQDPPEGNRNTIESELGRRQYDELERKDVTS